MARGAITRGGFITDVKLGSSMCAISVERRMFEQVGHVGSKGRRHMPATPYTSIIEAGVNHTGTTYHSSKPYIHLYIHC